MTEAKQEFIKQSLFDSSQLVFALCLWANRLERVSFILNIKVYALWLLHLLDLSLPNIGKYTIEFASTMVTQMDGDSYFKKHLQQSFILFIYYLTAGNLSSSLYNIYWSNTMLWIIWYKECYSTILFGGRRI